MARSSRIESLIMPAPKPATPPGKRYLSLTMRRWLSDMGNNRALSTAETITEFQKEFCLTPEDAGRLLVQWSNESGNRGSVR
jgi:hypothetical protein